MHFLTSFLILFLSIGLNSVSLTFYMCVAFSTVLLLTSFRVLLSDTTLNDSNLLALLRALEDILCPLENTTFLLPLDGIHYVALLGPLVYSAVHICCFLIDFLCEWSLLRVKL